MAWNDLASNQMVSFTDAQGGGFTLQSGQSPVTSNQCMTKDDALTKYVLDSSYMTDYASNQLVPKGAWVTSTSSTVAWDFNAVFVDGYGYLAIYNVTQGWINLVDVSGTGYYNGDFTVNIEDQLYIYIYGQSNIVTNLTSQVTVYVNGDPVDSFSDYLPDSTYIENGWYYSVVADNTYLSVYVGDL